MAVTATGGFAILFGGSILAGCSLLLDTNASGGKTEGPGPDPASTPDGGVVITEGGTPSSGDGGPTSSGSTYNDVISADGPVAVFHLDEPSGANFAKEAISGKEATALGTIQFGVPGVSGTAAKFTGAERLDMGDVLDFPGTYSFSLEVWVDPGQSAEPMEAITKLGGDPATGYTLNLPPSDGAVRPTVSFWLAGPGTTTAWWEEPIPQGLVHVVLTATNAGGKGSAVCYVNAQRSTKGDWGNEVTTQPPTSWPFLLARKFVGTLDEVAIYDKVLTPARVFAHYQAGKK